MASPMNAASLYSPDGYGVDGFDHTKPVVLEWRMKLSPSSLGNTTVQLYDNSSGSSGPAWGFFIFPDRVTLWPAITTPIVSLDTTDTFHTYQVKVPANNTSFELFIDGVFRVSGVATTQVSENPALIWGDASSVDSDTFAEWDYIRLTPVPLPAAIWLFGSGLVGLIGMARRKKA